MSKDEDKSPQRRRYRKIEVRMWGDKKFKELSPVPPCAQGLWVFLLTGPHTGPIPGLFRAGRAGMAEELDWPVEAFDKAFGEVFGQGMAEADWKAKVVWIPKAISCNKPESPNVVLSWGSEWDLIPECDLKREAYDALRANIHALGEGYGKAFDKAFSKPSAKPSVKPSGKTCGNQEQEQEQKQDKTTMSACADGVQVQPSLSLVPTDPEKPKSQDDVAEIFAYWQKVMQSPKSQLDDKRRKVIKAAIKNGYSPSQICLAIRGCSRTPHNMGQNDRAQKYNGIELILRNADQIDRFIENDAAARAASPAALVSSRGSAVDAENERARRLLFGSGAGEVIDG